MAEYRIDLEVSSTAPLPSEVGEVRLPHYMIENNWQIKDVVGIIQDISESAALRVMWDKYRKQFSYAKDISFEMILEVLRDICRVLS